MIRKIIKIAKEAGKIVIDCRKKGLEIKTKGIDKFDFVTNADLKSEEFILHQLKQEFPKEMILSEETKEKPSRRYKKVWMVDPLDGTKDFKNNGSGFSIMIGLCIDGVPHLGVVYAPAKKTLYYAEKEKGAFMEKDGKIQKLHVSKLNFLNQAKIVTRFDQGESRPEDKLINYLNVKGRILESSVGLKLGLLALGKAEFHINTNLRASKWDTCAPQIILEEAGGKITDLKGNPLNYKQKENKWLGLFVASNNFIHDKVIKKINKFKI